MEELHNIIADETLNVPATDEEIRDHAKNIIERKMSTLSEDNLTSHLKDAGITKMAIKAVEACFDKSGSNE